MKYNPALNFHVHFLQASQFRQIEDVSSKYYSTNLYGNKASTNSSIIPQLAQISTWLIHLCLCQTTMDKKNCKFRNPYVMGRLCVWYTLGNSVQKYIVRSPISCAYPVMTDSLRSSSATLPLIIWQITFAWPSLW